MGMKQAAELVSCLALSSTLKVEVPFPLRRLLNFQGITQRCVAGHTTLHSHYCQILKILHHKYSVFKFPPDNEQKWLKHAV
jgi:hypothetical protein